jgi:hypothetical protein
MKLSVALVGIMLSVSTISYANSLPDGGPKANFERSDLVVIGRVTGRGISYHPEYAELEAMSVDVEVVMKGQKRIQKIVVPYARSAEYKCNFGVVGERYLFLLQKSTVVKNVWYPVDGCYGVLRLQNTRVGYD